LHGGEADRYQLDDGPGYCIIYRALEELEGYDRKVETEEVWE